MFKKPGIQGTKTEDRVWRSSVMIVFTLTGSLPQIGYFFSGRKTTSSLSAVERYFLVTF
jgi:hypothetical protein